MNEGRPQLHVVRSAKPAERSVFDAVIERITPPSLDAREQLRDLLLPESLCKILQKHLERYGLELVEDTARDAFAPIERKYTLAKGDGVSVALLMIHKWIVGNGNEVGTVDEIRTAFEKRVVRVVSPECDAPSLALKKMFGDWKERYRIDARFIPWANLRELEAGYAAAEVLELELGAPPVGEPGEAAAAKAAEPAAVEAPARTRVFVSYAHRDEAWLEKLRLQLKPLLAKLAQDLKVADGAPLVWHDGLIEPGEKWRTEIREALAAAKVAVLLVSTHFLASDFIAGDELPPILAAAEKEGLRILWIQLDACNWEATAIADYQVAVRPPVRLDSLDPDDQGEALMKLSKVIVEYLQK